MQSLSNMALFLCWAITVACVISDEAAAQDCNANSVPDEQDIVSGFSSDCNLNERPDECDRHYGPEQIVSVQVDRPRIVIAADIDGDGDLDLAAVSATESATWYRNTDTLGTFGPALTIPGLVDGASDLAVADIDGDGDVDIVRTSTDLQTVSWDENIDGAGAFGEVVVIASGLDRPVDVEAIDLDSDGDVDVLSVNEDDDMVTWFENLDGAGLFGPALTIDELPQPRVLHVADLNGDDYPDVIVGCGLDDRLVWYQNAGPGIFGAQQLISSLTGSPTYIATADLDEDGDADILSTSSSFGEYQLAWYENVDSTGTFGPQQIINDSRALPASVESADLDLDGDADVLAAFNNDDEVVWFENLDGAAEFGPARVVSILSEQVQYAGPADVDGDGDFDVIVASWLDDTIAWFENHPGPSAFGGPRIITDSHFNLEATAAADIDGDGDLDVLSGSKSLIAWYYNIDGAGTFGSPVTKPGSVHAIHPSDLDGDGDMDVVTASRSFDRVLWHENVDGLGDFSATHVITLTADGAISVFAADLDGDGDADVLSASRDDDTVAWYENTDGSGDFSVEHVLATDASGARVVFAADLDGDGDQDVLSASTLDDKIAWYQNIDGEGTFSEPIIIATSGDGPRGMYAADLDSDGDVDVMTANYFDGTIRWFENVDGLGSFGPANILKMKEFGCCTATIYAADVDGDLDNDIVSANQVDFVIEWYENTDGVGTFGPPRPITSFDNPVTVVTGADLDGDGDADVLAASRTDHTVSWYELCYADCNDNDIPDRQDIDSCPKNDPNCRDCNESGTLDVCDIVSGQSQDQNVDGVPDECSVLIVSSTPPSGAVDAREPSSVNGDVALGWAGVTLVFDGPPGELLPEHFDIQLTGGDSGTVDAIVTEAESATIMFSPSVPMGGCISVRHVPTAATVQLSYLPGDVDGNGTSTPLDILALIDHLNGLVTLSEWQCDINRSELCEPQDILRTIDVLNGVGPHLEPWLDAELAPCP